MDYLLITIGSHGDVHPFVGLGQRLQMRGHRVRLVANPYFEQLVRSAGLEFIPLGTADDYLRLASDPMMWDPKHAFQTVFGAVNESLEQTYETVAQNLTPDTVVVSSSLCLGVRVAEDKLNFPHAMIHLAPSIFRTMYDTPKLPGTFLPSWLPRWAKRCAWAAGDRFVIDPVAAPAVNALRARLGLPPVKHVLREWWHAPRLTVGMFPAWFGPPQPDWPKQVRLTHFPLYDERELATALPPDLEAFLAGGEPPVAFTPGSAMFDGHAFFRAAVGACVRADLRGVLLTRHRDHVPADLPGNVIHVEFAPFSRLLPRVAALVHHAGIGTSSQQLAAGVPALVSPMCHDQLDNAARLEKLGVAKVVPPRRFTAERVAAGLRHLLACEDVRRSARSIAARFDGVDGLGGTCDLLESLAATRGRSPRAVQSDATMIDPLRSSV